MKNWSVLALGVALALGEVAAQEPEVERDPEDSLEETAPPPGALREAVRTYFRARLASDLGWTDAQVAEIAPLLDEVERERAASRAKRRQAMAELRRAMRQGAADDDVAALLERVESIGVEARERERSTMRRIDERLTPRQRVEFRAFVERFRRELLGKVDELRRERAGRRWSRGGTP
jgi:hypothetical protein